jgi:hypothetical protein
MQMKWERDFGYSLKISSGCKNMASEQMGMGFVWNDSVRECEVEDLMLRIFSQKKSMLQI